MAVKNDIYRARFPNAYAMAIFVAGLAVVSTLIENYLNTKIQAIQTIAQKRFEYRAIAYGAFPGMTTDSPTTVVSQILNIGALADHLVTDSEIQAFENRIANHLRKHDIHDIYLQLNVELNRLRLHGSQRVSEICDDILQAMLLRDDDIDWARYPSDVIAFHDQLKIAQQEGVAYGWKEHVTSDERLMIITIAKLTRVLIEQFRTELHHTSPMP